MLLTCYTYLPVNDLLLQHVGCCAIAFILHNYTHNHTRIEYDNREGNPYLLAQAQKSCGVKTGRETHLLLTTTNCKKQEDNVT